MNTEFCPKCGRIADYDSYYSKYFCTNNKCKWQSNKIIHFLSPEEELKEIFGGSYTEEELIQIFKQSCEKAKKIISQEMVDSILSEYE